MAIWAEILVLALTIYALGIAIGWLLWARGGAEPTPTQGTYKDTEE